MTTSPFGEPKATDDMNRFPVAIDIRAFNTNRCSKIDMSGLRDIVHIVGTRWVDIRGISDARRGPFIRIEAIE